MELTLNHSFILDMYKLVSVPNRNLIRWLLVHNCISCSELCFSLMSFFHHLYKIPIQYSSFRYTLNCLLNSYLKSVVKASSEFSSVRPIVSYSSIVECNLTEIFLHKSWEMSCIYIKDIDVPLQIIKNKSANVKTVQNTDNCDRKGNVLAGNDFHSFLLPLEQDYTKSSKGYNSHTASYDKVKDKNAYSVSDESNKYLLFENVSYNKISIPKGCEVICKQVQENESKSKNNGSKFCSDVISYLQDFNNDTQQISIQEECSRNICSKSNFNYSLRTFSDKVKQQFDFDCTVNNNSDSDDFVIFFENSILKGEKCDTNNVLHNSMTSYLDSDNDDASVLFENSEEQENESQDNINLDKSFEVFSNWDDDYDENDPDLLEKFNLEFSCSQNKLLVNPLSTCGYDNACFKDDDADLFNPFLEDINKNWNDSMKDVSSEPRISRRVSFVPSPELVSVETFEPDNDGYRYSICVFDQVHFQNRIQEFEAIINPYLTSEHRAKVFYQNYPCEKHLF